MTDALAVAPGATPLLDAQGVSKRFGAVLALRDARLTLRPGEVVAPDGAKLVGISQRRTRVAARFQCAVHRRWDPARLVDALVEPRPSVEELAGKRIATAYPVLLQRHLEESGVKADVVKLDGAVETACALGVADAVCDVVETGTTLRAAGLHIIGEPVLASEAILVGREGAEEIPAVAQLRRRIRGVLVARQYVMLDYDCPNELLERATAVTPGLEGPTVSPLHTPGWSAVRAMVAQADTNRVMDELWELGARAILVTSIHACRI